MSFFRSLAAVSLVDESFILSTPSRDEPLVVPAYIAIVPDSQRVLTIGAEAKAMVGRTAENIQVIKVLREGRPVDHDLSAALFRHCIQKLQSGRFSVRPSVVMSVRSDETAKTLAKSMAISGGARELHLIEAGMATAIGMDLPIMKPEVQAVLSISEDWFEFSIISVSSVLMRASGSVGSETFVEDIQNHLTLTQHFRPEADAIRNRLMTSGIEPSGIENTPGWEVWSGRSEQGRLTDQSISQDDLTTGIAPSLVRMVERIKKAIRALTPEQQYQLSRTVIHATGSAIRIPGLAQAISKHLGYVVNPFGGTYHPSIDGAKRALAEIKFLRAIAK